MHPMASATCKVEETLRVCVSLKLRDSWACAQWPQESRPRMRLSLKHSAWAGGRARSRCWRG